MEHPVTLLTGIFQLLKTGPLWHVLTVLLALLMFREVCQMSASLKRYLLSPENWMEMLVRWTF